MIASEQNNFIFVKTRKVAGTSLEIALSLHCGPRDIITPITPRDEIIRYRLGGLPRNFSYDASAEEAYRDAIRSENEDQIREAYTAVKRSLKFWNHMRAELIRKNLGSTLWDQAYKFTIERHPYEFVVSHYFYKLATRASHFHRYPAVALYEAILRVERNFQCYSVAGVPVVDRILRYENLLEELSSIAPAIQIDVSRSLPYAKTDTRPMGATADLTLNSLQKALIRFRWRRTFELFDYAR